jgi:hypothetical protein
VSELIEALQWHLFQSMVVSVPFGSSTIEGEAEEVSGR